MNFVTLDYTYNVLQFGEKLLKTIFDYSPKIIAAVILLIVGVWAIRIFMGIFDKVLKKRQVEPTLVTFLGNILVWVLRVLLFIIIASKLGIETSSFVAIIGAAGLAIGLSLQGSLSNFAGGVLIILFKPFKVGDYIKAQNEEGTVLEIQIFVTKLATLNNQIVFIPNGILSNGVITNFSMEKTRRIFIDLLLSNPKDFEAVNQVLVSLFEESQILKTPKPQHIITQISDVGLSTQIIFWCKNENFVSLKSRFILELKRDLDENGIVFQSKSNSL